MKLVSNKILFLATMVLASSSAFALKADVNQPINIVSDNQSLDMEKV